MGLREACQNSIEAVDRARHYHQQHGGDYEPFIFIGPNPSQDRLLCVADNGSGMTFEQAERHLNQLGSSGNTQYTDEHGLIPVGGTNHGTGVKVSWLPKNKGGLEYHTMPAGAGQVHQFKLGWSEKEQCFGFLWLDENEGISTEGLRRNNFTYNTDDDEAEKYMATDFPFEQITNAGHGTVLTCYGNDRSGKTPTLNYGIFSKGGDDVEEDRRTGRGISRFLNQRYESLEAYNIHCPGSDSNLIAKGSAYVLSSAELSGSTKVKLKDGKRATLKWYVLKEGAESYNSIRWFSCGCFYVTYKNENYFDLDYVSQQWGKALRRFGVHAPKARKRVVFVLDANSIDTKKDDIEVQCDERRVQLFYKQKDLFDYMKEEIASEIEQSLRAQDLDLLPLHEFIESMSESQPHDYSHTKDWYRKMKLMYPGELKNSHNVKRIKGEITVNGAVDKTDEPSGEKGKKKANKPMREPIRPNKEKPPNQATQKSTREIPEIEFVKDDEMVAEYDNHKGFRVSTTSTRFNYIRERSINVCLEELKKEKLSIPEKVVAEFSTEGIKNALHWRLVNYFYQVRGMSLQEGQDLRMATANYCNEGQLEALISVEVTTFNEIAKALKKEKANEYN